MMHTDNSRPSPTVTFETKCWEGDWEFLLQGGRLRAMIERNSYPFAVRRLMINNVTDYSTVLRHADRLVANDVLTDYVVVRDMEKAALNHFGLERDSFGDGYCYSIAELVSIFVCTTDYLLHFSGDSLPARKVRWIPQAITELETIPGAAVANLTWNGKYRAAKRESFAETPDFFIGYGFSDQCFMVRTEQFKQRIYSERNPASERYPVYGGELFEKRVDAWMRNNKQIRLTFKHGTYIHQNFPKEGWRRRLKLLFDRIQFGR